MFSFQLALNAMEGSVTVIKFMVQLLVVVINLVEELRLNSLTMLLASVMNILEFIELRYSLIYFEHPACYATKPTK